MDMSIVERIILCNQYKILQYLDSDCKDRYDQFCTILNNGYAYDYDMLSDAFDEEMSEEDALFVRNVLQMYRVLDISYASLPSKQKKVIEERKIRFGGFDGNNESEYLLYAEFLLKDLGMYPEVKEACVDTNSHHRIIEKYRQMLTRWEAIRKNTYDKLSFDEIKEVIKME